MLTKIKLLRLQRGIQQFKLARALGVSASYIFRAEAGQIHCPEAFLKDIAKFYDVNAEEYFDFKFEGRWIGIAKGDGDRGET